MTRLRMLANMSTDTEQQERQSHETGGHDTITHADLLDRTDGIARELRTEMRWLFSIGIALIGPFIVIAPFAR